MQASSASLVAQMSHRVKRKMKEKNIDIDVVVVVAVAVVVDQPIGATLSTDHRHPIRLQNLSRKTSLRIFSTSRTRQLPTTHHDPENTPPPTPSTQLKPKTRPQNIPITASILLLPTLPHLSITITPFHKLKMVFHRARNQEHRRGSCTNSRNC
jgi:hypothetical protein